jgi:uncharacterized membrane-anchored protein
MSLDFQKSTTINPEIPAPVGLSILQPMRYANVPAIDARYWTAITMASIFGCNLGDCLSFYAGWNHWIGLAPLALVLTAILFGERHSERATEAWYWGVVIVLRAAATNLADLATHTFEWAYPRVLLALAILQVLVVWPVLPRLFATTSDRVGRPATNGWYWLSLLTAGTLGTAAGDWVADELHIGTGYGTIILGAIFAVILALGMRSRWATKAAYWSAIVLVRAAGTTAGDWLAFRDEPGLGNGLKLGLPLSSTLTCAFFIGVLLFWKTSATDTSAPSAHA